MDFLRRTWVEIDLDALKHNYNTICSLTDSRVIPVVKADAYGHGAATVAIALQECGADIFAVSNVIEGIELREAGITGEILVLGYTDVDAFHLLTEHSITQCVYSLDYATALSNQALKYGKNLKVHLKLDTGMGRIGFNCRKADCDILEIVEALSLEGLDYTGVFAHFAVSDSIDESDIEFSIGQYERFCKTVQRLEKLGFNMGIKHCCNSGGTIRYSDMSLDAVRVGIILYGLSASQDVKCEKVIPVMSMYSVVSMVKYVEEETSISYGRTYISTEKRKIATVSAGYADGVPRLLSNKGYVFINGKKAPVVGRVCMDQFCIDVTDIDDVKMGDYVEIFGKNISADIVGSIAGTINYEIVCGITKRVPRVFIQK